MNVIDIPVLGLHHKQHVRTRQRDYVTGHTQKTAKGLGACFITTLHKNLGQTHNRGGGGGGGGGQGLFAESAMIIPCMQKMALSSVLVTPAQKRPFSELSPDTVRDVSMC